MSDKALLVRVTGRVQGVCYRSWTQAQAQKLGLRGWVQNESDGSVRALVAGPAADVNELVRQLQDGPSAASVSSVVTEATAMPTAQGFEIRR